MRPIALVKYKVQLNDYLSHLQITIIICNEACNLFCLENIYIPSINPDTRTITRTRALKALLVHITTVFCDIFHVCWCSIIVGHITVIIQFLCQSTPVAKEFAFCCSILYPVLVAYCII